jgi:T-complex protein 1 subunit beta
MLGSGTATQGILNQGATEEKGEIARLASFVGAMAVSDLVKTTLGPKGMDKILLSTVRTTEAASAVLRPRRTADTVR